MPSGFLRQSSPRVVNPGRGVAMVKIYVATVMQFATRISTVAMSIEILATLLDLHVVISSAGIVNGSNAVAKKPSDAATR